MNDSLDPGELIKTIGIITEERLRNWNADNGNPLTGDQILRFLEEIIGKLNTDTVESALRAKAVKMGMSEKSAANIKVEFITPETKPVDVSGKEHESKVMDGRAIMLISFPSLPLVSHHDQAAHTAQDLKIFNQMNHAIADLSRGSENPRVFAADLRTLDQSELPESSGNNSDHTYGYSARDMKDFDALIGEFIYATDVTSPYMTKVNTSRRR